MAADDRWKKFARLYQAGVHKRTITDMAIEAGYAPKSASSQGSRLLKSAKFKQYLTMIKPKVDKEAVKEQQRILGVIERQELLSDIAKDPDEKTDARIKAVDVMNKMDGVYVNKQEVSGNDGGPLVFKWEDGDDDD